MSPCAVQRRHGPPLHRGDYDRLVFPPQGEAPLRLERQAPQVETAGGARGGPACGRAASRPWVEGRRCIAQWQQVADLQRAPQTDSLAPARCAAGTGCGRYRAAPCAPPGCRHAGPHHPRTAPATPAPAVPPWAPPGPDGPGDTPVARTPWAAAAQAAPPG